MQSFHMPVEPVSPLDKPLMHRLAVYGCGKPHGVERGGDLLHHLLR